MLCPRCRSYALAAAKPLRIRVWMIYWDAVKSGKRLDGGIGRNEEGLEKEWNGGKKVGGIGVTLRELEGFG